MNTTKIILTLIVGSTVLLNSTFASTNIDSTKILFHKAYNEVKNMLDGTQEASFEKAVLRDQDIARETAKQ